MPYDSFPPQKLCEKCFQEKNIAIVKKTIYIRMNRKFKPLGLICPKCKDIEFYDKGNEILMTFSNKEMSKISYRNWEEISN